MLVAIGKKVKLTVKEISLDRMTSLPEVIFEKIVEILFLCLQILPNEIFLNHMWRDMVLLQDRLNVIQIDVFLIC